MQPIVSDRKCWGSVQYDMKIVTITRRSWQELMGDTNRGYRCQSMMEKVNHLTYFVLIIISCLRVRKTTTWTHLLFNITPRKYHDQKKSTPITWIIIGRERLLKRRDKEDCNYGKWSPIFVNVSKRKVGSKKKMSTIRHDETSIRLHKKERIAYT